MSQQKREVILFVNSVHAPTYSALRNYEKQSGRKFTPVVIVDDSIRDSIHELNGQQHLDGNVKVISADFGSPSSMHCALKPFSDDICAVTSQYENSIHELKQLIPYVPQLSCPTETSLDWATDKKLMREAFNAYDPSLSPPSIKVTDASDTIIDEVERSMSYPVIIKPSGLERSLLVAVARNRSELISTLAYTFQELGKAYDKWMKRLEPTVLVEEFMEGDMYSVDTYVGADGTCRHASPVRVVTGRKAGFEDFFSYLQLSPSGLDDIEAALARRTAENACKALKLRSVTAHTELMRTPGGWRIIEVGPRIGGYRHELYGLSHDMNHIMNDILNRAGEIPIVPEKPERYAAIFKTYAKEEGILDTIHGLEVIEQLSSYVTMKHPYKKGDALRFARNNGDAVIEITLCNPSEATLRDDIATIENILRIDVAKSSKSRSMPLKAARHR